jgi:hypothetical protein
MSIERLFGSRLPPDVDALRVNTDGSALVQLCLFINQCIDGMTGALHCNCHEPTIPFLPDGNFLSADAETNDRIRRACQVILSNEVVSFSQAVWKVFLKDTLVRFLSFYLDQTFPLDTIANDVEALGSFLDHTGPGEVLDFVEKYRIGCTSNAATLVLAVGAAASCDASLINFVRGLEVFWLQTPATRDAISLSSLQLPSVQPLQAAPRKRQRSGTRIHVEVPNPTSAKAPEHFHRSKMRTHSFGLRPLPQDVQMRVLEFLPPRYMSSTRAVCALWRALFDFSETLRAQWSASRRVKCAYVRFFAHDWGERCAVISKSHRAHWWRWRERTGQLPDNRLVECGDIFFPSSALKYYLGKAWRSADDSACVELAILRHPRIAHSVICRIHRFVVMHQLSALLRRPVESIPPEVALPIMTNIWQQKDPTALLSALRSYGIL